MLLTKIPSYLEAQVILVFNVVLDETIRVWNVHTGEELRKLCGHKDLVRTVQFDHKFIVSGNLV